jgi:uncharacterized protein YaaQ
MEQRDPASSEHHEGHEDPQARRLLLAIVDRGDADAVMKALVQGGYRFTRIDTQGGFLRRGNATLVIGIEQARVDDVLAVIQRNCRPQPPEPKPSDAGIPAYNAAVFELEALQFSVASE